LDNFDNLEIVQKTTNLGSSRLFVLQSRTKICCTVSLYNNSQRQL